MKKTIITIETIQRTTIRSRQGAKIVRCERCAVEAPSEAAAHQQIVRDVLQLAEAGEIGALETEEAGCPVCRDSLAGLGREALQRNPAQKI